jgi:hypothetical protein
MRERNGLSSSLSMADEIIQQAHAWMPLELGNNSIQRLIVMNIKEMERVKTGGIYKKLAGKRYEYWPQAHCGGQPVEGDEVPNLFARSCIP